MMEIPVVFNQVYFGNSLQLYIMAALVAGGVWLVTQITLWVVAARIQHLTKQTENILDDAAIDVFHKVHWWVALMVGIYFGSLLLTLPADVNTVLSVVTFTAVVFQVVQSLHVVIDYALKSAVSAREEHRSALRALAVITKYGLWVIAALVILSNVGINVTSLVAGLGIGGIAIAFALQSILEDLFSSFALYFDKPFQVGDFIVVGDKSGTVKKIGIKTTRLKSLQGEEIVVSNHQLTSAVIQNFKKLEERRVELHFGVEYDVPPKKLEKIPAIVAEILEGIDQCHHSRTHLDTLRDADIQFETVYFVEDSDFAVHMDIKQQFWLALLKRFEKEKIGIAYPTQVVITKQA